MWTPEGEWTEGERVEGTDRLLEALADGSTLEGVFREGKLYNCKVVLEEGESVNGNMSRL